MKKIPFIKMHGAGNDFVFLEKSKIGRPVTPALAERLLDRHFGIGGDQLLLLDRNGKGASRSPRLIIYNADGSQAEMCGNGVRAVATHLRDSRGYKSDFIIDTKAGPIGIGFKGKEIEVDMGEPRSPVKIRSLTVAGKTFRVHMVSMGNPHGVIFVSGVKKFPIGRYGPLIEHHSFFPNRVNVEFVEILSRSRARARVWERGAGETLACGTGACAIGVVAAEIGKTNRDVKIDLPGGTLGVRWALDNHVFLSGPAEVTYQGEFYV